MTRYNPNEPIEPFHVTSNLLKGSASAGSKPGGSDSLKRPIPPNRHAVSPCEAFGSPQGRAIAAGVFAPTFLLFHFHANYSAFAVVLLLASVMYRLDSRRRRIAAAPLTLSSAMLFSQIVASDADRAPYGFPSLSISPTLGATTGWLLLFLAACLFYAPKFPTYTEKILTGISLLLLGSGLLPGNGYIGFFATAQYFLFIAVAVGLGIDFKESGINLATQSASAGK